MSDKREKILNAALKLFTEKGIDSTSTASIAKGAGVGTGTVFHYFSSKEELINACYAYVKAQLRESLENVHSDDFVEQAKLYWNVAINWYLEHEMETTFINIYRHDPKVSNGKSLSIVEEMSGLVAGLFAQAQGDNRVKDFSMNYFFLLAHDSTILAAQYLRENPEVDRDEFIASTCHFFLEGILAKR